MHRADLTRQICNAWKSDRGIADVVLRPDIGRACARLGGWPGARLSQDNVLWKPPGGKALGFHQDSSYEQWAVPSEWVSCWIALEDTTAAQGTVEYVRGSHRWSRRWGMIEEFHGPDDPHAELRLAAAAHGVEPEFVPVEVPAGRWRVPRRVDLARLRRQRLRLRRAARWWPTACRPRRASTPRRRAISTAATSASATTPWTSRSSRSPGARTATGRRSSRTTSTAGSVGPGGRRARRTRRAGRQLDGGARADRLPAGRARGRGPGCGAPTSTAPGRPARAGR